MAKQFTKQQKFDAIFQKHSDNIVAVGKKFIGVKEKKDDMELPEGYTQDMVFELGELVFDSEVEANISGIGLHIYGDYKSRGTTSLLAYYKGEKVLVTNAHCATKAVKNKYGAVVPAYLESAGEWISPGTLDGGVSPDNSLGKTWYWYPNKITKSTSVSYDTAVIRLDHPNDTVFKDEKLEETKSIYQYVPAKDTRLISRGATTGLRYGKVAATGVTVYMRVGKDAIIVPYTNQIIIVGYSSTPIVMQGGDSGSNWRLASKPSVGVCQAWGGNKAGTYGIASPWKKIFSGMHLTLVP
jgi:hypothetical protein